MCNCKNETTKNKKAEIIVTQNSVRVVMTSEELLAQEYEDDVESIIKDTKFEFPKQKKDK